MEQQTGIDSVTQNLLSSIVDKSSKLPRSEKIFSAAAIIATVTFALILSWSVTLYQSIGDNWKAAIIAFIIFFPFAFFLQVVLHVRTYRQELPSRTQEDLRRIFSQAQERTSRMLDQLDDWEGQLAQKEKRIQAIDNQLGIKQGAISMGVGDNTSLKTERDQLSYDIEGLKYWIAKVRKQLPPHDASYRFKHLYIERVRDTLYSRSKILMPDSSGLYGVFQESCELFLSKMIDWNYPSEPQMDKEGIAFETSQPSKEEVKHLAQFRRLLNFDLSDNLQEIIDKRMERGGLKEKHYLMPMSFFFFVFFSGFMLALPFVNSVFSGSSQIILIPLFNTGKSIPILVIQWGFFGGVVYTTISLLNRFLRRDLAPRVYLSAALKLLLSIVAAIMIYLTYSLTSTGNSDVTYKDLPPQLLIACFAAGIAPIQLLVRMASTQLSKIEGWKTRNLAGNRPLTVLEGISALTADRLGEEDVDTVMHMALSDPSVLSGVTRFPLQRVIHWKEQAILYLVTGNIILKRKTADGKISDEYLVDVLDTEYAIRTWYGFNQQYYRIKRSKEGAASFFLKLGLLDSVDSDYEYPQQLFDTIYDQGTDYLTRYSSVRVSGNGGPLETGQS